MNGLFGTESLTDLCSKHKEMYALLQKVGWPNVNIIFSELIDDLTTHFLCQLLI